MKKILFLLILTAAVLGMNSQASVGKYSESEWKVRLWEIIKGLQPQGKTLWQLDRDSLDGWKVTGAGAELSTTDVTKLWGEKVVKMTFPKGGQATIRPVKPIEIKEPVDGIEMWVYGPINTVPGSAPGLSFLVSDADGKKYRLQTSGSGSRWNKLRWWGVSAAIFPKNIKFPVKLESMTFTKLLTATKNDFLCFDMIGTFNIRKINVPDTEKMDLPFPTTPDTIMPTSMTDGARNSVKKSGKSYIFSYTGKDANITYTYTPQSGTLGDITASVNGGAPFQIAKDGGVMATVDGVKINPFTEGVEARLIFQRLKNNKLKTIWSWTVKGQTVKFDIALSIKGKTLTAEISGDQGVFNGFTAGEYSGEGIRSPKIFGLTYLHNRWDYTKFLATNDFIASTLIDWYNSNASELSESRSVGGLKKAEVTGEKSARIMSGTIYLPKTDGKLNDLYERVFFTVSPNLEDVIPNIPNPVSPYHKEISQLVCATRAYALQGEESQVDDEIAFWTKMRDYGAKDIFIRFHYGQFRSPLANNRFSLSLDGSMSNGGDKPVARMISELRKVVPRLGVYQDNRVIAANDPAFEYGLVSIDRNGKFMVGWDGCFRPKPAAMLALYDKFLPEFLKKYEFNGEYLDELNNCPPWGDVDFDANTPGAGMFRSVFRAYGAVALQHRKLFNGPIWSEGCAAYLYAGLLDTDYAVSNDVNAKLPIIVDFKLRKINPLEPFTGADWPELQQGDVYYLLASMIAKGNSGHILGILKNGHPRDSRLPWAGRIRSFPKHGWRTVLKNYYMIRQLQELYFAAPVEKILYDVDGKLMTAGEMLKQGKSFNGRIYQKYANGLEIYVNRGTEGDWKVQLNGKEYILPVYGHVAELPGKLLQYSASFDGKRVDYSRGWLYTYADGNGTVTRFPEMTAANAYVLNKVNGETRLTPVPFEKAETLKDLKFKTASPLTQDGTSCGANIAVTNGELAVDGKAFHYTVK